MWLYWLLGLLSVGSSKSNEVKIGSRSVIECKERLQCANQSYYCMEKYCELYCINDLSCSHMKYYISSNVKRVDIILKGELSGDYLMIQDLIDYDYDYDRDDPDNNNNNNNNNRQGQQQQQQQPQQQQRKINIRSEGKHASDFLQLQSRYENDQITVWCLGEYSCYNHQIWAERSDQVFIQCQNDYACVQNSIYCPIHSPFCNIQCHPTPHSSSCQDMIIWSMEANAHIDCQSHDSCRGVTMHCGYGFEKKCIYEQDAVTNIWRCLSCENILKIENTDQSQDLLNRDLSRGLLVSNQPTVQTLHPTSAPTSQPIPPTTPSLHPTRGPVHETMQPTVGTMHPTVQTMQPTISTPEPTISTPEPTISTPEPTISTPEPTILTLQPTISTPEPTISTPEPTISTLQPTISTIQPTISTIQPTISTPEPTISTPEPTISTPEPTISTLQPTISTIQPTISTLQPTISTIQPTISTIQPTISTPEPTISTPEPTISTLQPTISTLQPTIVTLYPTMNPVTQTMQPTIQTMYPTMNPITQTVQPTIQTLHPTTSPSIPNPMVSPSLTPTLISAPPTAPPNTLPPTPPNTLPPTPPSTFPTAFPTTPPPTTSSPTTFPSIVPATAFPTSLPSTPPPTEKEPSVSPFPNPTKAPYSPTPYLTTTPGPTIAPYFITSPPTQVRPLNVTLWKILQNGLDFSSKRNFMDAFSTITLIFRITVSKSSNIKLTSLCLDCFEWTVVDSITNKSWNFVGSEANKVSIFINETISDSEKYILDVYLTFISIRTQHLYNCPDERYNVWYFQPAQNYWLTMKIKDLSSTNIFIGFNDWVFDTSPLPELVGCSVPNSESLKPFTSFTFSCKVYNAARYNVLHEDVPMSTWVSSLDAINGIAGLGTSSYVILGENKFGTINCLPLEVKFQEKYEAENVTTVLSNCSSHEISHDEILVCLDVVNQVADDRDLAFTVGATMEEMMLAVIDHDFDSIDSLITDLSILNTLTVSQRWITSNIVGAIFEDEAYMSRVITYLDEYILTCNNDLGPIRTAALGALTLVTNVEIAINKTNKQNTYQSNSFDVFGYLAHQSLITTLPGESISYLHSNKNGKFTREVLRNDTSVTCQVLDAEGNVVAATELSTEFINANPNKIIDCVVFSQSYNEFIDNASPGDTVVIDIYTSVQGCSGSQRRLASSTDNGKASTQVNFCSPHYVRIPLHSGAYETTTKSYYSAFPSCNFWSKELQMWNNSDCFVHNYTDEYVTCACKHFTTFQVKSSEFDPKTDTITKDEVRHVTVQNIVKYPLPSIVVLSTLVIFFIICLILPNTLDRPFLAFPNIVDKGVRDERLPKDISGKETLRMNKYLSESGSTCGFLCSLYLLYLSSEHALFSLCGRSEGTNFSEKQRMAVFAVYILALLAIDALYYGSQRPYFGEISATLIVSLASAIPATIVRVCFAWSKPKEIERDTTKNNKKKEKMEQEMELTEQTKKIDFKNRTESGATSNVAVSPHGRRKFGVHQEILDKIVKTNQVNVNLVDDAITAARLDEQDHREVFDAVRKKLFNYEYPLPHWCKSFSWGLVVAVSLASAAVVIIKGIQFDLKSEADEEKLQQQYPCGYINKQYTIVHELVSQLTNKFLGGTYSDDINDGGSDSQRWVVSIIVSLLWSILIWEPVAIFLFTSLRVWAFQHGLVMEATPQNCCACMAFACGWQNCANKYLVRKEVNLTDTGAEEYNGTDLVASLAVANRNIDRHLLFAKSEWFINPQSPERKSNAEFVVTSAMLQRVDSGSIAEGDGLDTQFKE